MKKNLLLYSVFIISTVLISCPEPEVRYEIQNPVETNIYYSDTPILFSTDINDNMFTWKSDKCGVLGFGNQLSVVLPEGNHRITLEYDRYGTKKYIDITVLKREEGNLNKILIQESGIEYRIQNRNIGIYSLDGTISNLKFENLGYYDYSNLDLITKDFVIETGDTNLKKIQKTTRARSLSSSVPENRSFYVAKTNTANEYQTVQASLFYTDSNFNVYVADGVEDSIKEKIQSVINTFNSVTFPRVSQIWGKCEDINNDGKFTFLFTPTINDENVAVGFFSQLDFYDNDENNPYSNAMDLLYVAVPDDTNDNYSVKCLCATMAHELTHAITYTNKTYKKFVETNVYKTIDLYINEGLSHITENLCGYGSSGGNSSIMLKYVNQSYRYSLKGYDYKGNKDTLGVRGGVCLFLYYLFDKAGNIEYDANGLLIDKGGITYLKSIVSSEKYDWDSLGDYFNVETDVLFKQFCEDMIEKDITGYFDDIVDPVTQERLFFIKHGFEGGAISDDTVSLRDHTLLMYTLPIGIDSLKINFDDYSGTSYLVLNNN